MKRYWLMRTYNSTTYSLGVIKFLALSNLQGERIIGQYKFFENSIF